MIEDGTEADDEAEDSVNWIGRRQEGSACFVSPDAQKTTTFAEGKHPAGGFIVVRGGRRGEKKKLQIDLLQRSSVLLVTVLGVTLLNLPGSDLLDLLALDLLDRLDLDLLGLLDLPQGRSHSWTTSS